MLEDITGIQLIPGNGGRDCSANGEVAGADGKKSECCCDECSYLMCCTSEKPDCELCADMRCPRRPLTQKRLP